MTPVRVRPAALDGAISRLRPEEIEVCASVKVPSEDYIALTVQVQPDSRPGRGGIELVQAGPARMFALPFVALLPEHLCTYSTLTDQRGQPLRSPTQGMLPALMLRLVIPRVNLTESGWTAVERSETFDDLNQLAGWTTGAWTGCAGGRVLPWVRHAGTNDGPVGGLVLETPDAYVASAFTPAGYPFDTFTSDRHLPEQKGLLAAMEWCQTACEAYRTRALLAAQARAEALNAPKAGGPTA